MPALDGKDQGPHGGLFRRSDQCARRGNYAASAPLVRAPRTGARQRSKAGSHKPQTIDRPEKYSGLGEGFPDRCRRGE